MPVAPLLAITAVTAVAGAGVAAYGMSQQQKAAKQQAAAQTQMIEEQQRQEAIRQKAMELDARRKQMEVLRNQQRARSIALATATSQGAGLGSGLQGGFGQIAGQTGVNLQGINQNLVLGRDMFASNMAEGNAKIAYAQAGSRMAMGQGLSSLGGMLLNNAGTIGSIGSSFGGGLNQFGGYLAYGTNPFTPSGARNPYYG